MLLLVLVPQGPMLATVAPRQLIPLQLRGLLSWQTEICPNSLNLVLCCHSLLPSSGYQQDAPVRNQLQGLTLLPFPWPVSVLQQDTRQLIDMRFVFITYQVSIQPALPKRSVTSLLFSGKLTGDDFPVHFPKDVTVSDIQVPGLWVDIFSLRVGGKGETS